MEIDGRLIALGSILGLATVQLLGRKGSANAESRRHRLRRERVRRDPERARRIDEIIHSTERAGNHTSWCEVEDWLWGLEPDAFRGVELMVAAETRRPRA